MRNLPFQQQLRNSTTPTLTLHWPKHRQWIQANRIMDTTTNTFQETETSTSSASTPQPTTPPTTLTNTKSGAHNRSNPLALSICTQMSGASTKISKNKSG